MWRWKLYELRDPLIPFTTVNELGVQHVIECRLSTNTVKLVPLPPPLIPIIGALNPTLEATQLCP